MLFESKGITLMDDNGLMWDNIRSFHFKMSSPVDERFPSERMFKVRRTAVHGVMGLR